MNAVACASRATYLANCCGIGDVLIKRAVEDKAYVSTARVFSPVPLSNGAPLSIALRVTSSAIRCRTRWRGTTWFCNLCNIPHTHYTHCFSHPSLLPTFSYTFPHTPPGYLRACLLHAPHLLPYTPLAHTYLTILPTTFTDLHTRYICTQDGRRREGEGR